MTYDPSIDLCRRKSQYTQITVDIACRKGNVREAAAYLSDCGIPFEVAHRVLLHPTNRRCFK